MKKYKQLSEDDKESALELIDMLKQAMKYYINDNDDKPINLTLDGKSCQTLYNYINNIIYINNTLMENLCLSKQKYNNDKSRYRRKAKIYRNKIIKSLETIQRATAFNNINDNKQHYEMLLYYILQIKEILLGDNNENKI